MSRKSIPAAEGELRCATCNFKGTPMRQPGIDDAGNRSLACLLV